MIVRRPSQWSELFETALSIIAQAAAATYGFDWTFGGGTALMAQIDHRESHDVDLFLTDPQLLPFLNPATQAYDLDRQPDGYDGDGSRVLKLMFDRLGEIDFICCSASPALPPRSARSWVGLSTSRRRPRSSRRRSTIGADAFSHATCSISRPSSSNAARHT